MAWLSDAQYGEVSALAFESYFREPESRPQCKRRECIEFQDFWDSRLKQAYRKLKPRFTKTVPLDAALLETIVDPASFDSTLGSTIASETERKVFSALTEMEREIAELSADGDSMDEIRSKTGSTLYRIKKVRAEVKRLEDAIRRDGDLAGPVVAAGNRRAAPESTDELTPARSVRRRYGTERMTPEEIEAQFIDLDPGQSPHLFGSAPREAMRANRHVEQHPAHARRTWARTGCKAS